MDAESAQPTDQPTDRSSEQDGGGKAPLSRRAVIGWAGAGVAIGAAAMGSVAAATMDDKSDPAPAAGAGADIAFYGDHQSGIATPVQDRLHFAAFDVSTTDRDALVKMLKEWTKAAAAMTGGREVGTGAASGLPRHRRTTPARRSACPPPG